MTETTNKQVIKVDSLSIKYGNKYGLQSVTFDINEGDFVALVGSNGSGKSTLLNSLSGLLKPNEGKIFYEKDLLNIKNPRSSIGFASQNIVMDWYLNVWENVYIGCVLAGYNGSKANKLTRRALERVDLLSKANDMVDTLSGGQQQRVQIARGIVHEPEIFVLDEPTTGLDPKLAENFFKFLKAENKSGKTVIVASHDLHLLEKYASKILFLEHGNIKFYGDKNSFFEKYSNRKQYLVKIKSQITNTAPKCIYDTIEVLPAKNEDKFSISFELRNGYNLMEALAEINKNYEVIEVKMIRNNSLRDVFIK